ncbi:MAG: PASTA domain-containing protein [Clostridiales bacterium]|nr:PASTA domain-containing protein [Clostridiales bacterium]
MRKHVKGFVMGVLFMLILSATVAVVAAPEGVWRQIFHGVNVTLNGNPMEFDDEDRPFILDGRTFLPVRAISEALDFEVFWVAETSTVYIDATTADVVYEPPPQPLLMSVPDLTGLTEAQARTRVVNAGLRVGQIFSQMSETAAVGTVIMQNLPSGGYVEPNTYLSFTLATAPPPQPQPFWTTVPHHERSNRTIALSTVNIFGNTYGNAISNVGQGGNAWSHHALNGQFSTITGAVGRVDGTSGNRIATISFIGDGRDLASFSFGNNTMMQDVSIDVTGVVLLRIEIEEGINFSMLADQRSPRIAFVNAMIQ